MQISDNVSMPLIGFGTAGLGNGTQRAVQIALASGYRLIDTAQVGPLPSARRWTPHASRLIRCGSCVSELLLFLQAPEWYREAAVGAALRNGGVDRWDIFLTSKLHPRHHGYESALRQLNKARYARSSCLRVAVCVYCTGCQSAGIYRENQHAMAAVPTLRRP